MERKVEMGGGGGGRVERKVEMRGKGWRGSLR